MLARSGHRLREFPPLAGKDLAYLDSSFANVKAPAAGRTNGLLVKGDGYSDWVREHRLQGAFNKRFRAMAGSASCVALGVTSRSIIFWAIRTGCTT